VRKFGAVLLVLLLALPAAVFLTGAVIPDIPADNWPDGLGAPIAGTGHLDVFYWDDNLRLQTLAWQDLQLTSTGRINRNWATQAPQFGYGEFDTVVGTTGVFQLTINTTTTVLAPGIPIVVEFTPGIENMGDSFVWTNIPTTSVEVESTPSISHRQFTVGYTSQRGPGIYRVIVRTRRLADDEIMYNVYWVFARNRFRAEWNVGLRLNNSSSATINVVNPPFNPVWNLSLWQSRVVPANVRLAGVTSLNDNLSIKNSAGVEVLNNSNTGLNLFTASWDSSNTNIVISLRTIVQEGQTVPVQVPNDEFTISARVLFSMNTITLDGVIIEQIIPYEIHGAVINFTDPPPPRRFPWWILVVGVVVLLLLGAGIVGTNWLIQNSQNNHDLKLSRKAREIAEQEEENYSKLRQELGDEYEDERIRIELFKTATEVMDQLDQEEGK